MLFTSHTGIMRTDLSFITQIWNSVLPVVSRAIRIGGSSGGTTGDTGFRNRVGQLTSRHARNTVTSPGINHQNPAPPDQEIKPEGIGYVSDSASRRRLVRHAEGSPFSLSILRRIPGLLMTVVVPSRTRAMVHRDSCRSEAVGACR